MKKQTLFIAAAMGFLMIGSVAQAADVKGFRSARFGASEKAVIDAAVTDLGVKSADIQRAKDSVTKVTTLTTKLKSFAPLNLPALVTYVLGYKCNCLTQVGILWDFTGATEEQRKTAIVGVTALVNRFAGEEWGKDETVMNRVTGDVKEGSTNVVVFFRGQNKDGGAITMAGAPVKMMKASKDSKKDDPLSANIDDLKTVSVSYEKDAANPDIFRVDVTGF
ncbi:MAG: hypothetical protein WC521_02925 [Bdellovibrionales bacterium]